ncbi:MAG: xanthine dehydrogenase family protein subunit M [Armatimonadota bacterium]|nr:xanthine dehydrogenase family protein subunit M [Armatimonadota bacterium]MDR7537572.1 xanthine dehydrogenase family protein subunit M [Armatimonadota bacterium]
MKPAAFEYLQPTTRAEVLEVLHQFSASAKVLAGGQSLVPLMNLRLARPAVVVDINRIGDLAYLRREDGALVLGALVRHRQLERDPAVGSACPILQEAARHIGYPAVRNRGTVGGSVAHADPAAELPCVLLAAGATVVVESRSGRRAIPIDRFFVGPYTTQLRADELLVEVRVPAVEPDDAWGFAEFARHDGGFALALAACVMRRDPEGRVETARVAVGGVTATPERLVGAEETLRGQRLTDGTIDRAAEHAAALAAHDDIHATATYRRRLARWLVREVLRRAAGSRAA